MSSTPISLYLDLEPGHKADLVVVARASLAFAQAIKEAAFFLEPGLEVKIEFESGTEGSLSLNSILKSFKTTDGKDLTLAAIGGIVLFWFGNHLLDWSFDQVMDMIKGQPDKVQVEMNLSPQDMKTLQELVDQLIKSRIGEPHVQQVYRELEADPAVKGVGATRAPRRRPAVIVPRSEFPRRAGTPIESPELITTTRPVETNETLILIRPVLLPGHRRWRFAGKGGEFGAPVLDDEFIQNLIAGNIPVQMSAGIEMDVTLQTVEQKDGSIWRPIAHNVLKVRGVRPSPSQQVLNLPSPMTVEDDDED